MVYLTAEVRARENLSIVGMTVVDKALIDNSRVNGIACGWDTDRCRLRVFLCATVRPVRQPFCYAPALVLLTIYAVWKSR